MSFGIPGPTWRISWVFGLSAGLLACGLDAEFSEVREVQPAGLSGQVALAGLGHCAGVQVQIEGPTGVLELATDADGRFAREDLPGGAYRVLISIEGWTPWEDLLLLRQGEVAEIAPAPLPPATVPVRGRVRLADQTPAAGASVSLSADVSLSPPAGVACGETEDGSGGGTTLDSALAFVGIDGAWLARVPAAAREVQGRVRQLGYTEGDFELAEADVAAATEDEPVDVGEVTLYPLTGFVNVVGPVVRSSLEIPLQISAFNGASEMALGEMQAGVCAYGAWQAYAASVVFELAPGDGLRTLCVRVRNDRGQQIDDLVAFVEIDTAPPSGSLAILGPSVVADPLVVLATAAVDSGSGVAGVRLAHAAAALATAPVLSQEVNRLWTLEPPNNPGVESLRTVWMDVLDRAGNASSPVSASVLLDRLAPRNPAALLRGVAGGGDCASPGWWSTPFVEVLVTAEDASLDGGGVRAAEPDAIEETAWQTFANRFVASVSPGSGLRTLHVQIRDAAGNVTGPVERCLLLDTQPPELTILSARGAGSLEGTTRDGQVHFQIHAEDNLVPRSQLEMCVSGDLAVPDPEDCAAESAAWQPFVPEFDVQLPATPAGTVATRTVSISLRDPAGNLSPRRLVEITDDRDPPTVVPYQTASMGARRADLAWGAVEGAVAYEVAYDFHDRPAASMIGSGLEPGPSPIWVTGTTLRVEGLRSMEPVHVRVRARDAAGNLGPDPGSSVRILSAQRMLDASGPGMGDAVAGQRPRLAAAQTGDRDLVVAYRSASSNAMLLRRCAEPCTGGAGWEDVDGVLGGGTPGSHVALLAEQSRVWLAHSRTGTDRLRVGMCETDRAFCWSGPWDVAVEPGVWVAELVAPGDVGAAPLDFARSPDGRLWLAVGNIDAGGQSVLSLYTCDGSEACATGANWTRADLATGTRMATALGLRSIGERLWLVFEGQDDRQVHLRSCAPLTDDCLDPAAWSGGALGVDGGLENETDFRRLVLRGEILSDGRTRATFFLHTNDTDQPWTQSSVAIFGACDGSGDACADPSNWQTRRDSGGDSPALAVRAGRVLAIWVDSFSSQIRSLQCTGACDDPAQWHAGVVYEEAGLDVVGLDLVGYGDGNFSAAMAGLGDGTRLLRPLLFPPRETFVSWRPNGVRLSWAAADVAGYTVGVGTTSGSVELDISDPAVTQLDAQISDPARLLGWVRSRSEIGSSERGAVWRFRAPQRLESGLAAASTGSPANDGYVRVAPASAGSVQAVLRERGPDELHLALCSGGCGDAGDWTDAWLTTPGGMVDWYRLAGDPDGPGFLGAFRTRRDAGLNQDLHVMHCASGCGDHAAWQPVAARPAGSSGDRPGRFARPVLSGRDAWVAHVVDLYGRSDPQHWGPLELLHCDTSGGCTDPADWVTTVIDDGTGQSAVAAIAAGPEAVWVAAGRYAGEVMLHECLRPAAGAAVDCRDPGNWSGTPVRDQHSGGYGSNLQSWDELQYERPLELAYDPMTRRLFLLSHAWRTGEVSGVKILSCHWTGPGACADPDAWRVVWPAAAVNWFFHGAGLFAQEGRVHAIFATFNDVRQTTCGGDCDAQGSWPPLVFADEVGDVGFGMDANGRVNWFRGTMQWRRAQLERLLQ